MSALAAPLPAGAEASRGQARKRVVRVVLGSVAFGAIAGLAATGGSGSAVFGLIAIFVPIALWRRPSSPRSCSCSPGC